MHKEGNYKQGKKTASEWEKIIANKATDKELISKIYKQLLQLNSRKINNPIKKMGQRTKQTFVGKVMSLLLNMLSAATKSLQFCLTLCDPIDGSPPGSPILGILQARTLEWVAISFSNA